MKNKESRLNDELVGIKTIPLERAKEIMKEEGLEYTDQELKEILDFISKVISITTCHHERLKQRQAKIISITAKESTDETKGIFIHQGKYRRAS